MEIPKSLQPAWSEVSKDKNINAEDFQKLLEAAAPNHLNKEFDQDELKFLLSLKNDLENNSSKEGIALSEISFIDKPEKLPEWPGYNKETIGAFKDTYKALALGVGVPYLSSGEGNKIAAVFGKSSIPELQQLVKAKADCKFGPETLFKSRNYVQEQINKNDPAQQEQIKKMAESVGIEYKP